MTLALNLKLNSESTFTEKPSFLWAAFPAHLLDVVVGERAAIFQLLPGEDQPLLIGRDSCREQTPADQDHHCFPQ